MTKDSVVFIIDDDFSVCESIVELLASRNISALAFDAISEYLKYARPEIPSCIVLDVGLPNLNGLEFQKQAEQKDHPPIIFITGHGDIPSAVGAIQRGAIDFLIKPFNEADLIRSIDAALQIDARNRAAKKDLSELQRRLSTLTPREREVLPLVASGFLNKQAAAALGISEVTLQVHRGKIMQKLQAGSLADLVRIAQKLQIPVVERRGVVF